MLIAAMMWCGDEECDCWVGVVMEGDKELWRGEFIEHPTPEQKIQQRESLAAKAKELGATIVEDMTYGK